MAHLRHNGPRHIHIPDRRKDVANWNEIERFSRNTSNYPFCVKATGDPGNVPSGAPGAAVNVVWTAPTNPLYDLWHMVIGGNELIRIPQDGFYSFWMNWQSGDNFTAAAAIKTLMDTANTSITGFAAPSWTRYMNIIQDIPANPGFGRWWNSEFRGIELHANDLVRFGIQVYSTVALSSTIVVQSEFIFESAIPVDR